MQWNIVLDLVVDLKSACKLFNNILKRDKGLDNFKEKSDENPFLYQTVALNPDSKVQLTIKESKGN